MKRENFFDLLIIAALLIAIIFLPACKKSEAGSSPSVPQSNPLTDSLVACFKFNGDLSDSTGKNIAGVSSGAVSLVTDRKGNNSSAVNFGASAKLTLSGIKIPNPNTVTLSYWVKSAATVSLQYYIVANQTVGIAASQSGNLFFGVVSTPSTNSAYATIVDNNWHHLVTTYNGTNIKFYLDGALAATTNHPGNITNTTYDYVIGFFNSTYWQGNIDELRIYKTVLTDSQVLQLSKL